MEVVAKIFFVSLPEADKSETRRRVAPEASKYRSHDLLFAIKPTLLIAPFLLPGIKVESGMRGTTATASSVGGREAMLHDTIMSFMKAVSCIMIHD